VYSGKYISLLTYYTIYNIINKKAFLLHKNIINSRELILMNANVLTVLKTTIDNYKRDINVQQAVAKKLESKGIGYGEFFQIWNSIKDLKDLNEIELYLYTKALFDATKEYVINPDNFFSKLQQEEGNKFYAEIIDYKISYPYTIHEVIEEDEGKQWITVVDVQTLLKWRYGLPINYNFDTQREAEYDKKGLEEGTLIKIPKVNPKTVEEITERLINEKQFSDTITLNILHNGNDNYDYNKHTLDFTLYEGCKIDNTDGYKRLQGIIAALSIIPNLNKKYSVRFTNYDISTAQKYINQIQTVATFEKEQKKSFKESSSNDIMKTVEMKSYDFYKHCVTTNKVLIQHGKKLVLQSVLTEAIDYNYKLNKKVVTRKESESLGEWIAEFMDEIIGIYPEAFITDVKTFKEKTVINYPFTFIGYIALSAKLYNIENWKEKLKNILCKIDFDINNDIWKKTGVLRENLSKVYVKKISDYFQGVA
jgi:hypothetical protein